VPQDRSQAAGEGEALLLVPKMLGMIDTRKSIGRPFTAILKRPSCGTRRSEMSSSDMTLMREMICSASSTPRTVAMSASTPSSR